jgi:hypothetical protein
MSQNIFRKTRSARLGVFGSSGRTPATQNDGGGVKWGSLKAKTRNVVLNDPGIMSWIACGKKMMPIGWPTSADLGRYDGLLMLMRISPGVS